MKSIFTQDEANMIVLQRSMGMRQPLQEAMTKMCEVLKTTPDVDLGPRQPEMIILAAHLFDRVQNAVNNDQATVETFVGQEMKKILAIAYALALDDMAETRGSVPHFKSTGDYETDLPTISKLLTEISMMYTTQDEAWRKDEILLVSTMFMTGLMMNLDFSGELEALNSALLNMYLLGRLDERDKHDQSK